MKKIIFILLLLPTLSYGQADAITIVLHDSTLWLKNFTTNDSIKLNNRVPTVSGQSGKFITTDGTGYLWADAPTADSSVFYTKYRADTSRDNIYSAINGKQATLSGTGFIKATGTTISYDNSTYLTTSSAASAYAPLANPAFTGTPTGIGIPVYAQVTGSNVTTTGQALTDITGLSVALTTNATYEFEAVMSVSTSAVTTGTAYGVQYSAAGAAVEAQITGSSSATATKTLRISALNSATALYLAGSGQTGGILIKGRITTGANAGNLTIQHLKLSSGTSTVLIGSFLKLTRIQ